MVNHWYQFCSCVVTPCGCGLCCRGIGSRPTFCLNLQDLSVTLKTEAAYTFEISPKYTLCNSTRTYLASVPYLFLKCLLVSLLMWRHLFTTNVEPPPGPLHYDAERHTFHLHSELRDVLVEVRSNLCNIGAILHGMGVDRSTWLPLF
jgi:hypothetical protein